MTPRLRNIAVLSDIHGMLPVLDAVLAEPDVRAADQLVVLGDVAAGPQPCAVMDRLLDLHERVLWVRGNADREMLEYRRGDCTTLADPIALWAAARLQDHHLRALEGQPLSMQLTVADLGEVLLCHASPRSDEEALLVDSPPQRWASAFAEVADEVDTVVCGHTHMPFVRLVGRRLVVNPGSVGLPYGRPGAHWTLLGPGIDLRRTRFDLDDTCRAVRSACDFADLDAWLEVNVRIGASEAEARAAFAGALATAAANPHRGPA